MTAQLQLFDRPRPPAERLPCPPAPPEPWRGFAGLDAEFKRRSEETWARLAARRARLEAERAAAVQPASAEPAPLDAGRPVVELHPEEILAPPEPAQDESEPQEARASTVCPLCRNPATPQPGQRYPLCIDCQARLERAGWSQVAREQLAGFARAAGLRPHCPRCLHGDCLTCSSAVETDTGIAPRA